MKSKTKNISKKILSVLLCLLVVFQIMPSSLAVSTSDDENKTIIDVIQQVYEKYKAKISQNESDDSDTTDTYESTISSYPAFQKEYFDSIVQQARERLGVGNTYLSLGYGGGSAIAEVAMGELGKTDVGEGYKYSIAGGAVGQAWCASFISWCGQQLGYDTEGIMTLTASSIGQWNYYAQNPDRGTNYTVDEVVSGTVVPQAGDFIVFSKGTRGTDPLSTYPIQSHIAMVYSCDGTTITTIEGNWSGKVSSREISISSISEVQASGQYVFGFSRPNYPTSSLADIDGAINKTVSGLRIDTDGSESANGSSTWQSSTSFTTADGKYYDCTSVNVVVNFALESCSSSSYGYCVGPHTYNTALGNCLAAVQEIDENGEPISEAYFGVVGDNGHEAGEVSLAMAQNMGFTATSAAAGVSTDHKFIITYFPNCKLTLYANSDTSINDQINEQANTFLNSLN